MQKTAVIALVFALTLAASFLAAWLGRRHSANLEHSGLANEKLNKWLVGLSAGAAANSGFVVTGAVGLGYTGGTRWVLLPIGWLVGDIVFWRFFPQRINRFGRESQATTLSELLTHGLQGGVAVWLARLCALIICLGLSGYLAAQWLAGQKFLAGAFDVPALAALGLFAIMIITYTAIGGFRGSVYVDSVQAVIRVIGTALALFAILWVAGQDRAATDANLAAAGPTFLAWIPDGAIPAIGLILGIAAAALGFGLGQPQLVSRYLAGSSPEETQSAWWIYIGFVQFTWVAMTVFGVYLRGVMPGIGDPEAGLSVFFEANMPAVLTGIIVADIFATIAATSNALLVAIGQSLTRDLLPTSSGGARMPLWLACALAGLATMLLSLALNQTVLSLALSSVALVGAGVAPAVLVRVAGWRHTGASLLSAVVIGLGVALFWRAVGFDAAINEALPGILAGLLTNAIVAGKQDQPRRST